MGAAWNILQRRGTSTKTTQADAFILFTGSKTIVNEKTLKIIWFSGSIWIQKLRMWTFRGWTPQEVPKALF